MKKLQIKWNDEQFFAYHITTAKDADKAVDYLRKNPCSLFGLDIETAKIPTYQNHDKAGLDPHLSTIRLIQIYHPGLNKIFIFDESSDACREFLSEQKFIAHNAIFEIKHFLNKGIEIDCICSMILGMFVENAEHSPFEPADDEQEARYKPTKGFGLASLVQKYLGKVVPKALQVSDWNAKELSTEQLTYAALDAVLTYKLGKHLYPIMAEWKMKKAFKMYKEMQYVIAEMELNGMGFDKKAHDELIDTWKQSKLEAESECYDYFGATNMRSPKQLHEWVEKNVDDKLKKVWPRSEKTKNFSFNKQGLLAIQNRHPAIEKYMEYKKYATLLSTFGQSLQDQINPKTNRIHCSFSLGHTRTGRLSSREPNLQNMPARGDSFRHIFVAGPGNVLVVADFSQIEIRVAGELSRDPEIRGAYERGEDLHKAIVSDLEGKPVEEVTKDERQLGKAINFGLQFGMGARKLAFYAATSYGVEMSESDSERAYTAYHKRFNVYSSWCDMQRNNSRRSGFCRTPMGKVRKLAEGEEYTKAVNTPVQGGAAEVSYAALIELRKRLKDTNSGVKILNTVHDEIILECPKPLADYSAKVLKDSMVAGMAKIFPETPGLQNLVEVNSGLSWAAAK